MKLQYFATFLSCSKLNDILQRQQKMGLKGEKGKKRRTATLLCPPTMMWDDVRQSTINNFLICLFVFVMSIMYLYCSFDQKIYAARLLRCDMMCDNFWEIATLSYLMKEREKGCFILCNQWWSSKGRFHIPQSRTSLFANGIFRPLWGGGGGEGYPPVHPVLFATKLMAKKLFWGCLWAKCTNTLISLIARLNRYTPNFSGLPQKLTWCQQFGLQIFPKWGDAHIWRLEMAVFRCFFGRNKFSRPNGRRSPIACHTYLESYGT